MLKKICIAVFVGALLSPVGYAASKTGGKGVVPHGSSYCSKKARAAGGSHPVCTTTSRSTVTKYRTVSRPVTTTRYTNRTTTFTKYVTYTSTHSGGGEVVVTVTVVPETTPTETKTETDVTTTILTAPTSTYTDTRTATDTETETVTTTEITTTFLTCSPFGNDLCDN